VGLLEKFMETNSQQYKTLGSVGGMGGTATAGGYNQGNQIAGVHARGDSSPQMAGSPKSGGNAMVGGHFGPTTGAANAASGYNQGDSFAASAGDGKAVGLGGVKKGGNALNGAFPGGPDQAPGGSGYAQGDEYAATTK
jgi:hypothetical protein